MAERFGIPRGAMLNSSGVCPECNADWSDVSRCQVCGGPAKPGDRWAVLGWTGPGEELPILALLEHAIDIGEIDADENGSPDRAGLRRLMFALYGHVYKRSSLYWWIARRLVGEYFSATVLGYRVAHDEAMKPKAAPNG